MPRNKIWLAVWLLTVIAAGLGTWIWAEGYHERVESELIRAHERKIAQAQDLIIARSVSQRDIASALHAAATDTLAAEIERLEAALGVALTPTEVATVTTETAPPVAKTVTKWLTSVCPGAEPLELPELYATSTEARLETPAGSIFAVGEVEVWIDLGPEADELFWRGPWKAEATELFRVEPTELKSWRLDLLAGLTTDPGWALGAQWQGRSRWGFWGLYSAPFDSGSTRVDNHQIVVQERSEALLGGISLTLGRR